MWMRAAGPVMIAVPDTGPVFASIVRTTVTPAGQSVMAVCPVSGSTRLVHEVTSGPHPRLEWEVMQVGRKQWRGHRLLLFCWHEVGVDRRAVA